MKKYILFSLVAIVCSMLIVSPGFASPLADYSLGKTAVDISWMPNLNMKDQFAATYMEYAGEWSEHNGKKGNFAWGLTTGLGGKWAVQYRQFNPESKRSNDEVPSYYGMKTQEFNVLYKVDNNLSLFAGWHQAKYTSSDTYNGARTTRTADNKDVLQAGLVGTMKIAPKTLLYGIAGIGKDLANYETGVSYEVAKDLEFNLFYRYKKVEKLKNAVDIEGGLSPFIDNVTAKGVGFGFTYKF